jgi:coatomer protein complex subunit alpha (xenin)
MVYQRTQNFDGLSMLYVMTGNVEKLKKMLKIADVRGDVMAHYHNAMLLGDVEDQVNSLKEVGQLSLAYLAAKTHGLEDEAASILEAAGLHEPPELLPDSELLKLPTPINQIPDENWPLLSVSKNIFESGPGAVAAPMAANPAPNVPMVPDTNGVDWGDDLEFKADSMSPNDNFAKDNQFELEEGDGWGDEDDFDIPSATFSNGKSPTSPSDGGFSDIVSHGVSLSDQWVRNSGLAVYHCAAGSFESAMQVIYEYLHPIAFESPSGH